jgi:hypothetical protein
VLLAGDLAVGFWLLEVDSRAEAAEWGRQVPRGDVEITEDAGYRPATRRAERGNPTPPDPDEFLPTRQSVLPWES